MGGVLGTVVAAPKSARKGADMDVNVGGLVVTIKLRDVSRCERTEARTTAAPAPKRAQGSRGRVGARQQAEKQETTSSPRAAPLLCLLASDVAFGLLGPHS